MKVTYLTYLPGELEKLGFPSEVKRFRAFNAARPAGAAAQAALRAPETKYPYSVEVVVFRAEDLGSMGLRTRTYYVQFERSVKKVEVRR